MFRRKSKKIMSLQARLEIASKRWQEADDRRSDADMRLREALDELAQERITFEEKLSQERDRLDASCFATTAAGRTAQSALDIARECRERAEAAELQLEAERQQRSENRLDALVRKEIAVHSVHEHTLEGFVVGVHADALVLGNARYMMEDGTIERLQGEQVIPFASIEWISDRPTLSA